MVYIDTEKVLTKCNNCDSYFKLNVPQPRDADEVLMASLGMKAKEVCAVEEKRALSEKAEEEQEAKEEESSRKQQEQIRESREEKEQKAESVHRQPTNVLSSPPAETDAEADMTDESLKLRAQKTDLSEETKEDASAEPDVAESTKGESVVCKPSDGLNTIAKTQDVAEEEKSQDIASAESAKPSEDSVVQASSERVGAAERAQKEVRDEQETELPEHTLPGKGVEERPEGSTVGEDHGQEKDIDQAPKSTEQTLEKTEAVPSEECEGSSDGKSEEKEAEADISLVDDPSRPEKEEIVGQIAKNVIEIVQEKEEEEFAKEIEEEIDVLNKSDQQAPSEIKRAEQDVEDASLKGVQAPVAAPTGARADEAQQPTVGSTTADEADDAAGAQQHSSQVRLGVQRPSDGYVRDTPPKSRSMTSLCAPTTDQQEMLRQHQELRRQQNYQEPSHHHLSHHSLSFTEKKHAIAERFLVYEKRYIATLKTTMEAAAELVESSDVFRYLTAGEANEIFANLSDLCVFHTRFYEYVEKLGPSETLLRVTLKEVFRKLLFEAYSYYLSHRETGRHVLEQKMAQSRELSARIKKFTERKRCEDLRALLDKPSGRIKELEEYYKDLLHELGDDPRAKDAADALEVIKDLDEIKKRAKDFQGAAELVEKYALPLAELPRRVMADYQMTMMVQHNRSVKLRDVRVVVFSDAAVVLKGRDESCIHLFHLEKAELRAEEGDTDYPIFSLKEGDAEVKLFSHSTSTGKWVQDKVNEGITTKKGQQLFGVKLDELNNHPETVLELVYVFNVAKRLSVNCEGVFRLSVASSKLQKVVDKMNYGIVFIFILYYSLKHHYFYFFFYFYFYLY